MKTDKITLSNGKEVNIKEVAFTSYLEAQTDMNPHMSDADQKKEQTVRLIEKTTDLSREDINSLNMGDGIKVVTAVNSVNGLADLGFQKPQESTETL